MKKNNSISIKNVIILTLFILVVSISGSYAATNYVISAKKVEYSDNSNLGVNNVQAAIDGTCTKFSNGLSSLKTEIKNEILFDMYPVGSIYISTDMSTIDQVKEKLGGEWEVYGKGKTLVGVDSSDSDFKTVNKTGGSKTRTLSVTQIPSLSVVGKTETGSISSSGAHTHSTIATSTSSLALTAQSSGDHSHGNNNGNFYTGSDMITRTTVAAGSNKSGILSMTTSGNGVQRINATTTAGAHTHNVTGTVNIPALAISSSGAHTHTIPSLSVSATYKNDSQTAINIQNPYITVYMYRRVS